MKNEKLVIVVNNRVNANTIANAIGNRFVESTGMCGMVKQLEEEKWGIYLLYDLNDPKVKVSNITTLWSTICVYAQGAADMLNCQ